MASRAHIHINYIQVSLLFIIVLYIVNLIYNSPTITTDIRLDHHNVHVPSSLSLSALDRLTLRKTQSIINAYITQLSHSGYIKVQDEIIINGMHTNYTFPHLRIHHVISSLSHHNIWIAGDSTVENLYMYLLFILTEHHNNNTLRHTNRFNFEFDLTLINKQFPHLGLRPFEDNPYYHTINKSILDGWNIRGPRERIHGLVWNRFADYNISFYGGKVQQCGYYPTTHVMNLIPVPIDIIISNFDLLFCLHIMNPFTDDRFHKMHDVDLSANIEFEHLLDRFVNNSIVSGVQCLIFYGANTVDDSKYYDNWKLLVEMWSQELPSLNHTLLNRCLGAIGHRNHPEHVMVNASDSTGFVMTAFDLCTKAVLMSTGAFWSSQRLYSWIEWKQEQLDRIGVHSFRLLYFNQTQITENMGKYTEDGRHYLPLLPVKTEAVTNIISNFCNYS